MKNKGQSILEYALLIVAITAALLVMGNYLQNAVSSNVKGLDNQIEIKPQKPQ